MRLRKSSRPAVRTLKDVTYTEITEGDMKGRMRLDFIFRGPPLWHTAIMDEGMTEDHIATALMALARQMYKANDVKEENNES